MKSTELSLEEYRATETHDSLMNKVIKLARYYGYEDIYHTWKSLNSPAGFPDLVLARRRDASLIFAEIKTQKAQLTPAQQRWIDLLKWIAQFNKTMRVYVWRPSDWDHIVRALE